MVRATYQKRLSAIILGIRPSTAHLYGSTGRAPADNLTHLGHSAWRIGLEQLVSDLVTDHDVTDGERWIEQWITRELERDAGRWSDVSTLLELLAISLGPATADPSVGPRGRRFWTQWHQNILHLRQQLEVGAAEPSWDSADLLDHCIRLVEDHGGPDTVLADVRSIGSSASPITDAASFRPLASTVERLQLSVILASAYDASQPCTAAMARLVELRPPSAPCEAHSGRPHRLRDGRYRSTAPDR